MNRNIKNYIALFTTMAIFSYPLLQLPIQGITYLTTSKISIEQAKNVIKQEKNKFGFESKIELIITEGFYEPHASYRDGKYTITAQKESLKEWLIKHETYHIIAGHLKNRETNDQRLSELTILESFKNFYINEPKAILYQFGLISK